MSEADPHIHVEQHIVRTGADARNAMVSMLGFAPDLPSVVTTGCRVRVPFAMTSLHPEKVTCLPCREFAQREYLRLADQITLASRMPGVNITAAQAAEAAAGLRDIGGRFGAPGQ
ncbi:hypothetical protein [Nocardia pseudobrasiliensis]|uniref:Uncharacterized protein n=1 Tax=Nocardia pseudobrasiliensis TaxID=45979 RepID=A0A370I049_9NOCA|nr:hypothetical protein [Nocardia pseudobrasiliensis]RDI63940.1 hypothetical protein DFR76_109280 [Nocardia pseudobrasiliensis]